MPSHGKMHRHFEFFAKLVKSAFELGAKCQILFFDNILRNMRYGQQSTGKFKLLERLSYKIRAIENAVLSFSEIHFGKFKITFAKCLKNYPFYGRFSKFL